MIQKKETSWGALFALLIPILIAAYYISGIFTFDDLTIRNYSGYLVYVFKHFYQPLRWYNAKTGACIGVGLIAWIFLVSYIQYHYRNFQAGKEYGVEDWADPVKITEKRCGKMKKLKKRTSDKNDKSSSDDTDENVAQEKAGDVFFPFDRRTRILTRDLYVPLEGQGTCSNNNMLVIGSSGTFKTTSVVTPNLLRAQSNFIVLDVKGELMYKYGLYLESKGYTIRCLNLKDQEKSDFYNPFAYIETEEDVIKLISNIYDSLTPDQATGSDPFWNDGPLLYLQSVFFYEWIISKKENRTGTINNVLKYINEEMIPDPDATPEKGKQTPSLLQKRMNELADDQEYGGDMCPAVRDYRKFKAGAAETVRSIVIIVNAKLKLCETQGLKRIFSDDALGLRDFAYGVGGTKEHPTKKKLALFMCVNDNDESFNFICSMVYSQALEILSRIADRDFPMTGLPVPLEFWMDEFYAGARPHDTEKIMGVIRSRNISMIPILQSIDQIKVVFSAEKWGVIMDNCPVLMFLGCGAGAYETQKFISDLLGTMTIDTFSDGKNGQQFSGNYNKASRELMKPAEVKAMDRHYAIIFMEEEQPIYDRKALPWEMPEKLVPFKEAMALDKASPDGGYIHPVEVYEDPKTGEYATLDKRADTSPLKEMVPDQIPEGAKNIKVSEDEFLNMDLKKHDKSTGVGEYYSLFMGIRKQGSGADRQKPEANRPNDESSDIEASGSSNTSSNTASSSRNEIDFSGTLKDFLVRYFGYIEDKEALKRILTLDLSDEEKKSRIAGLI